MLHKVSRHEMVLEKRLRISDFDWGLEQSCPIFCHMFHNTLFFIRNYLNFEPSKFLKSFLIFFLIKKSVILRNLLWPFKRCSSWITLKSSDLVTNTRLVPALNNRSMVMVGVLVTSMSYRFTNRWSFASFFAPEAISFSRFMIYWYLSLDRNVDDNPLLLVQFVDSSVKWISKSVHRTHFRSKRGDELERKESFL